MSVTLIIIATICYLLTCLDNLRQQDYPHSLMWFSYALANLALVWYEYSKRNIGS
jgi:hypothetical protein